MQQRWSATAKEAFAVYQSVLKVNLYLRRAEWILHCDHKPLKPFLSKGVKLSYLNRWSMELAEYNITFVHIKGKNNVCADVISRLKMLDIYKEPMKNQKITVVSNTDVVFSEGLDLTCLLGQP